LALTLEAGTGGTLDLELDLEGHPLSPEKHSENPLPYGRACLRILHDCYRKNVGISIRVRKRIEIELL